MSRPTLLILVINKLSSISFGHPNSLIPHHNNHFLMNRSKVQKQYSPWWVTPGPWSCSSLIISKNPPAKHVYHYSFHSGAHNLWALQLASINYMN